MKVLITDGLEKEGLEILKEGGIQITNREMNNEELLSEIPLYDALLVRSKTKVTRQVIEAANKLKIIGRVGVGVDNIDVNAASEKGIVVKNAPFGSTKAVAEETIALLLNVSRNIPQAYLSLKDKVWRKKKYKGVELSGKTLGIIGYR